MKLVISFVRVRKKFLIISNVVKLFSAYSNDEGFETRDGGIKQDKNNSKINQG